MRFIIVLIILLLISCGTTKQERQMKDIYKNEFKTVYFKSLLRKGFNNDKGYNNAVEIDNSHFSEPILSEDDYTYIDSITTEGNKFMAKDSLESIGRRAEGAEGKLVFYYALDRYTSKWLDSICKQRIKIKFKTK